MKHTACLIVPLLLSALLAGPALASEAAAVKDPIRSVLLESKEKNRGVAIYANGATINGIVVSVDDRYVTARSQQTSRIDGVSAFFKIQGWFDRLRQSACRESTEGSQSLRYGAAWPTVRPNGKSGRDLHVFDLAGSRGNRQAVFQQAFDMKRNGFTDGGFRFLDSRAGRHAAGQVRRVSGEVVFGAFDHYGIAHVPSYFFKPACMKI